MPNANQKAAAPNPIPVRTLRTGVELTAFGFGGLPFEFRFDYGYDGIMRSWEDSLQRLGLSSIDLLLIHDLDSFFHDAEQRFSAHFNHLITSGKPGT